MKFENPCTLMPTLLRKAGADHDTLRITFIFHKRGLERMQAHDPMTADGIMIANLAKSLGEIKCFHLHDIEFEIAYEEDEEEFNALALRLGHPKDVVAYIRRGYQELPEDRVPSYSLTDLINAAKGPVN